eukprot:1542989-Karenia_brevis.AAC.1
MPQNQLVDLVLQRDAVIRSLRDKCKTFGKRFGIADKQLAKYKAPDAMIKSDPSDGFNIIRKGSCPGAKLSVPGIIAVGVRKALSTAGAGQFGLAAMQDISRQT